MADGTRRDAETGGPPFHIINAAAKGLPIVIAVPHAGRDYSANLLDAMRDPLVVPVRLEDRHADTLAEAVAQLVNVPVLIARTPRAVIDLNRSEDDVDWGMVRGGWGRMPRNSAANRRARSGLGLVPRRIPGTGEIWRTALCGEELAARIEEVHRPYHSELSSMLEMQRDRWGAALLVDLHSMPPLPGHVPGRPGPRIVLGDRYGGSCDPLLSAGALRSFSELGWQVAHNRPYAGGYVLDRHGNPRRRIHAMQVEVCRSTYLDEALDRPGPGLADTARGIARLVSDLAEITAALGRGAGMPQAAE